MKSTHQTELLTVVIPTYRRPAMLARAIRSVLAQGRTGYQVCVYDNASGDETEPVVRAFLDLGAPIRYYRHPENLGANANFQFGLAHVDTDYFLIMSDDDLILPGCIERAMQAFERWPRALFVASPVLLVDPIGRVLKLEGLWPQGIYVPPAGVGEMVRRGHFVWTGTVFRRQVLERVGSLDDELGLISDVDFLLRAAAVGPFATVTEPGAIFARHPDSPSSLPRLKQFWPSWVQMAGKLASNAELPERDRQEIARLLEAKLVRKLPLIGLFAASRGISEDGFNSARILLFRYHRLPEAVLVWVTTWLAARLPLLRSLLSLLAERIRWRSSRQLRALQKRFDREYQELFQLDMIPRKKSAA